MGFEEGKFLEAAQEIDNIKLDGFEFFTESVNESVQCKIYRKYEEVSMTIIKLSKAIKIGSIISFLTTTQRLVPREVTV